MTVDNKTSKEQTIFNHIGNKIKTEDREINVVARLEEPLIVVLENVLSDEECDGLIEMSKDKMNRSKIGVTHEVNEIRTSSSMFFLENEYDILTKIEKRISTIMNIPAEHGEGIQILKYTPGQEYKAHFDFFTSSSIAAKNNRISTIILYLNDVEHGGETFFPKLNFSVSPRKGMAVYFEYFYNDKNLNELTLHGGAPVITGEKWVATQWMRRQSSRS
ncbi:2OG-Fe(II) oxygenase [Bacillus sp. Soil745]|uniref:2OG-Fe(II) oxygenase n=1 Tax=Peribacillus frigoritolerans TaxID=450367 RepID=UPI00070DEA5C|nr:2OG-Fe(II) oxygenase [Peribacillus frigoritolerans]KRF51816.1 2OG-Fe(II) oxygenase [Bacillus sp. Soil745]MED3712291.1 2OG-Fe(II) oxygenase [Peribacillus frigoritolerans]MED3890406.1 2OG-Fe(II) oxygenase [Peribacillus frigoritolerans]PAW27371.1 2OG-Fe(II) oxygenase [Peribacillus simplex]